MASNELKHYGVLGMKWGIRKDRVSTDRTKRAKLTKAEKKAKRKDLERRYLAGKKRVETMFGEETMSIVSDSAAVAAGALWIASAIVPGAPGVAMNTVAAIANMVSIMADKD